MSIALLFTIGLSIVIVEECKFYGGRDMHKTNNSVYDLQYHLVLVTKYRHKVLVGDVKCCLEDIIHEVFEQNDLVIIEMNIQPDHVHIMFDAKPTTNLAQIVGTLKSTSTKVLLKKFRSVLSKKYWKPRLWNPSYCICTVSERTVAVVRNYIRSQ